MSTQIVTLNYMDVSYICWTLGLKQGDEDVTHLLMWRDLPSLKHTVRTKNEEIVTRVIEAFTAHEPRVLALSDKNSLREMFSAGMAFAIEKRLGA